MASTNNFQPRSSSASASTSYMIPLHKTQLHPRFSLSSPSATPTSKSSHSQKQRHLFIITTLSLLPFTLYLLLTLSRSLHLPSLSTFGLIIQINPSSSSSQIHVFQSLNEISGTPLSRASSESFRAGHSGPGFSGRALERLLVFGRERVPRSQWKDTKVQLMVTSGDGEEVGVVLEESRKVLRSSGFLFRDDWASVLTGEDEGLFNWVAVNYFLGYIGNKPQETAGVIVLGRSALQVSFASSESVRSKSSRFVKLAGVSYNLFTQSLQQLGQDAVWKMLHARSSLELRSLSQDNEIFVSNACIPRGHESALLATGGEQGGSHAAGNFSSCKSELMNLLNKKKGKCTSPPCELDPLILSKLERKPHPQQRFFLSSELRGLVPKASLSDLEAIGHHFCEDGWENLKSRNDIDETSLSRSCFSHAFMAVLLRNSFGIPFDDKRVGVTAGSTPVDWRLGAFISGTLAEALDSGLEDLGTEIIGNESLTYFLLLAVVLVFVLLAAFFVMRLRKPQLKTIYDLEKGRYIVTRVPR